MGSKSTDWRPGPTVCRCCLSEGCYKDISTEYFWMGKREVYAEMLSETFSLSVAYSQSGGPNSNSRLICEPCISRLRDASDFRRQVQECEKTFMAYLDPGSSVGELEVTAEPVETPVKMERVKLEKEASDDDFDDRGGFDDDDDDDLDDQPLTKLASKVPKKESVDLLDLLDNAKAGEKRKSSAKAKTPAAKKSKGKKESKATSSKAPKPEKKKKDVPNYLVRRNAELLIKHTTAYPFRVNLKSLRCVFCGDLIDDPDVFRAHMAKEHETFTLAMAFVKLPKTEPLKADITDLKCRLCLQNFTTLKDAAEHLKDYHDKPFTFGTDLGVMPYHLKKDRWRCAVCDKSLPSLLHLNKHTITHFQNHVCDICGKSYKAASGLGQHVRVKHDGQTASCRRCQKVFPSMEAKALHQRTEKNCMLHCCMECPERFPSWELKQKHMIEVHGMQKKVYRCTNCEWVCEDRRAFYDHFKLKHSQDCLLCIHCGLKFATPSRLNRHLEKHAV